MSKPGYYRYRDRPLAPTKMRRQWLTGLIQEAHTASRGTYGYRRVHAELTMGMGVTVSSRLPFLLMQDAGIYGLPGPARVKRLRGVATADDLVNRKLHRAGPNQPWVTDITEHPTREGKLSCCCVLDTDSRRVVGWSIDSSPDTKLVINALDMALKNRHPGPGGVVHADHGSQFTSWAFGEKIRSAGLMPSFGTVGDGLDGGALVVGPDGVSLTSREGSLTVLFSDCRGLLTYPDGARRLIGGDAVSIAIEPTLFEGVTSATVAAVDAAVDPSVHIVMPERSPDEIPQPVPEEAPPATGPRMSSGGRVFLGFFCGGFLLLLGLMFVGLAIGEAELIGVRDPETGVVMTESGVAAMWIVAAPLTVGGVWALIIAARLRRARKRAGMPR